MVLIVRIVDPPVDPTQTLALKNDRGMYKVGIDGHTAVFFPAEQKEPPPAASREQPRLHEKGRGNIYTTPCAGIIDDGAPDGSTASAISEESFQTLLQKVHASVLERRNVTIVNRGSPSTDKGVFYQELVNAVVNTIAAPAERALQIVADEIAKEKQMQRLLQSEEDSSAAQIQAPKPPAPRHDGTSPKRQALALSHTLMQRMNALGEAKNCSPQKAGSLRLTSTVTSRGSSAAIMPRFTLLAGSYDDALVPPHVAVPLTPKAFTARPPPRAEETGSLTASRNNGKRPGTQSTQKSSKDILAKVALSASEGAEPTVIHNNGWDEDLKFYYFNGLSSVMILPPIPRLEEAVKSFTVDFWIKTDCRLSDGKRLIAQMMEGSRPEVGMLMSIGLNWHMEHEESIRLFIRDAGNRSMECLIPVANVLGTNEFHHITIQIKNIDDGKVEAFIDNEKVDRVKYLVQEHPTTFNVWRHRLSIGGSIDDTQHVVHSIRGSICEFRLWRNDQKAPLVRWPLVGENNGRVIEATHTIDEDQKQELLDVRQTVEPKPLVCPYFDENLVVNLGSMGLLGELLDSWSVTVTFKTSVTNRSMSLIGITDGQQKMSEFGIVLNAEPVLSKEKFRYHEFHATFFLVDCWGQTCSALLRGSDRQSLVDNNWHTLSWRVVDSETNRFEVKVDGTTQDLLMVYRDGPKNFCTFRDWVCLGGHNVRGWKVKNVFQGRIKGCSFAVGQEPYSSISMNEGPGASVLIDRSGHRNHGLLISPAGKDPRRHDIYWSPCALSHKAQEEGVHELAPNVVLHKNNNVGFAALQFGPQFDKDGVIHEVITDLTNNKPVDIVPSSSDPMWGTWNELPVSAFHNVETCAQLKDNIHTLIKHRDPRSTEYLLLVIKVGDCAVSLLDMAGPFIPPNATFDVNMMKWKYALAIAGSKGRRTQHLNGMMHGVDKLLLELSTSPQLILKIGPQNLQNKKITSEQFVASLKACGIPWKLPAALHSLILHDTSNTSLHCVANVMRTVNEEEATSVALLHKNIQTSSQDAASIMIQRNWRCNLARKRVVKLEEERTIRKQRVEEIMALRRTNPLVQAKKAMRALVITCHEFSSEIIQPITSNNPNDLIESLRSQGYNVEHVRNPSRSQFVKAISSVEADSNNFVYISAYGGQLYIRELPPFSLYVLSFGITESSFREELALESGRRFRQIINEFYLDLGHMLQAKLSKTKKTTSKNANQTHQAQQQRQLEETFRVLKEELTKEESEARAKFLMRDYESQCSLITTEMRNVLSATNEFESFYRSKANQSTFIVPSDCKRVELFPDDVFNVDDVLSRVLHKQMPPMGLQCVVAVDIVGLTPMLRGSAYLACSTGHTVSFTYSPQQRHILSWYITKALQGAAPRVPLKTKDHILQGAVETPETQRDWRSFATYVCNRTQQACSATVPLRAVHDALAKELPYVADVIPIRMLSSEAAEIYERARRERESKRLNCACVFAVDSSKLFSDIGAELRPYLQAVTVNEVLPPILVSLIFLNANSGIDGARMELVRAEVEKCVTGDLKFTLTPTNSGVQVHFNTATPADKVRLQQSINLITSRSLSWRFQTALFASRPFVEVERVEVYFTIKASGTYQKFRQIQKLRNEAPLPFPTMRFVDCYAE
jgi:hypothetical protein